MIDGDQQRRIAQGVDLVAQRRELGTIGATPAVVNAVIDAFDHAGQGREAEQLQMPLTAPKLWALLARR